MDSSEDHLEMFGQLESPVEMSGLLGTPLEMGGQLESALGGDKQFGGLLEWKRRTVGGPAELVDYFPSLYSRFHSLPQ